MTTTLRFWTITTFAGIGEPGYTGDGRPAIEAALNEPKGIAVDRYGHVYVADSENHVIRRIDRETGIMTTVAGMSEQRLALASPVALDGESERDEDPFADVPQTGALGYRQQADLSGTVRYLIDGAALPKRFSGDGGPARHAALHFPTAVAVDDEGTLFVADQMNHRVRRIDAATGSITTLAGTGQARFSGDGGPAELAALNEPAALALDGRGRLFIADQSNHRVRVIDLATGSITTFAGTGAATYDGDEGAATAVSLAGPSGLCVQGGRLYIADTFNGRIRAVDLSTGLISTVVGDGGEYRFHSSSDLPSTSLSRPSGVCVDAEGRVFVTDSDNHLVRCWDPRGKAIVRLAGSGTPTYGGDGGSAAEASLNYPFGIAVAPDGALLIADTFNHRIRRLSVT